MARNPLFDVMATSSGQTLDFGFQELFATVPTEPSRAPMSQLSQLSPHNGHSDSGNDSPEHVMSDFNTPSPFSQSDGMLSSSPPSAAGTPGGGMRPVVFGDPRVGGAANIPGQTVFSGAPSYAEAEFAQLVKPGKSNPLYDSSEALNYNLDQLVSQVQAVNATTGMGAGGAVGGPGMPLPGMPMPMPMPHHSMAPAMSVPGSMAPSMPGQVMSRQGSGVGPVMATEPQYVPQPHMPSAAGVSMLPIVGMVPNGSRAAPIAPSSYAPYGPGSSSARGAQKKRKYDAAIAPVKAGPGEDADLLKSPLKKGPSGAEVEEPLTPLSAAPGRSPENVKRLAMLSPRLGWCQFDSAGWGKLYDSNMQELPPVSFHAQTDKGFTYSPLDDSFVCQKKNHFQVTVQGKFLGNPAYVTTPQGPMAIDGFLVSIQGLKIEVPLKEVAIDQSQPDRSKRKLAPTTISVSHKGNNDPDHESFKVTVQRLHFAETTSNNMRKKGRPNPSQRYFVLVVSVMAQAGAFTISTVSHRSQRIIVRASNPGQFDNQPDLLWAKGKTARSVVHHGNVGINNDLPTEALTVNGNIRISGALMQTSDERVKEDIVPVETGEQLDNVKRIPLYHYRLKESWAEQAGRTDSRDETGVLAQELREVLPDAVRHAGRTELADGEVIDDLLVVNKERLFMENVGAVQELCRMTENLENRIRELEALNAAVTREARSKSNNSTLSRRSSSNSSRLRKGLSRHVRNQGSGTFPWLRMASTVCLALLVASVLAVGVAVLITNDDGGAGTDGTEASADATAAPQIGRQTTLPPPIGTQPPDGSVIVDNRTLTPIDTTVSNKTKEKIDEVEQGCPNGCLAYEFCAGRRCDCLYGELANKSCIQQPCRCGPYGLCPGAGDSAEGGSGAGDTCVCIEGWTGASCDQPTRSNGFISSLSLWVQVPDINITAPPFNPLVSEHEITISAPPDQDSILVLFTTTQFEPNATTTVARFLYSECKPESVVVSPFASNWLYDGSFQFEMGVSSAIYMSIIVQAPDSTVPVEYQVIVRRGCATIPF